MRKELQHRATYAALRTVIILIACVVAAFLIIGLMAICAEADTIDGSRYRKLAGTDISNGPGGITSANWTFDTATGVFDVDRYEIRTAPSPGDLIYEIEPFDTVLPFARETDSWRTWQLYPTQITVNEVAYPESQITVSEWHYWPDDVRMRYFTIGYSFAGIRTVSHFFIPEPSTMFLGVLALWASAIAWRRYPGGR